MLRSSRRASSGRRGVVLFCLAAFVLIAAVTWWRILRACGGAFTYALDDPYIHLALSERIRQGTYGINPGEPASPSSSIVWPFLLTPFSSFPWYAYAPLLLNLLFGAVSAWMAGDTVEQVANRTGRTGIVVTLSAVLIVFGANLTGLPFVGLEHSLQVLLCILVARAVCLWMNGSEIRPGYIVAAALGPMVRYECFLVVGALAILLWVAQRRRAAITLVAASLAGPIAFSLYLHHLGLPPLPASVMVKAHMYGMEQTHGLWWKLKHAKESVVLLALVLVDAALLAGQLANRRDGAWTRTTAALAGALLVGGVHLLRGPMGWFFRYEDYAVAYMLLITLAVLFQLRSSRANLLILGCALGSAVVYSGGTLLAPRAAREIHLQQYQMHRFVTDFYHGNFAVNDIGWTSFQLSPHQYVLDLFGLGSQEAQRHPAREPAWLDEVARRHHVGLVMIYPRWFPQGLPKDWTPVARLCMARPVLIEGAPVVNFYSTPEADRNELNAALRSFSATLPQGSRLETGPVFSSFCQN